MLLISCLIGAPLEDAPDSGGEGSAPRSVARPEGEADPSRLALRCQTCGETVAQRSKLLLKAGEEEADWAGTVHGLCQKCSGLGHGFKTRAKRSWEARSRRLFDKASRARTTSWATIQDQVMAAMPGLSNAARRALVLARSKAAAMRLAADLLLESPETLQARQAAASHYLSELDRCARDVDAMSLPIAVRADVASHVRDERAYFTSVTKNRGGLVFCAATASAFFYGRNDNWIKHQDHYWFRCPNCLRKYAPFKTDPKYVSAQKVLVLSRLAMSLVGATGPVPEAPPGGQGDELAIPCTWPNTAEDDFLLSQADIYVKSHARDTISEGGLVDFDCQSEEVRPGPALRPWPQAHPLGSGHGGEHQEPAWLPAFEL